MKHHKNQHRLNILHVDKVSVVLYINMAACLSSSMVLILLNVDFLCCRFAALYWLGAVVQLFFFLETMNCA